MIEHFKHIIYQLFKPDERENPFSIFNPRSQFDANCDDPAAVVKALNAAFIISLAGSRNGDSHRAETFIKGKAESPTWADLTDFYLSGKEMVYEEINTVCTRYPDFTKRLDALNEWLSDPGNGYFRDKTTEKIWSVFFPEGAGIIEAKHERIEQLRKKRTIRITELNASPITDPCRQMIFTSNVLITVPDSFTGTEDLALSTDLKHAIFRTACEPQLYWYDHPIRIGVKLDQNEAIYGLRGLNQAVKFERDRGNMQGDKIICVLSVSVTHRGLHRLAKRFLEEEISRSGDLENMQVYAFTEADTDSIVQEILAPAATHYLGQDNARETLHMFGVDGEYGRHYSFLKAISAFWNVMINSDIKGTFKIDLDQVFPQKELVEQSKASAFEHFKTALWGARGTDSEGSPVELGMIAGALVNERDLGKGLYTADVEFPNRPLSPEEMVFYSALPQALSTEAEMMARYGEAALDGSNRCIQRFHVTGGTNGILVGSLRRHRPFTPSFIGRAEDQAYILSVRCNPGEKLAYVHKDGLIMRHDKEVFAQDAIEAASLGKLVGDYIRILIFSKYASVLSNDISSLKNAVDPFTGCFISLIPRTVVFLRFCLSAASLFALGENERGVDFVTMGVPRIRNALDFVAGENSLLKQSYDRERVGWGLYYDVLEALEQGLGRKDPFALGLRIKAEEIIRGCLLEAG